MAIVRLGLQHFEQMHRSASHVCPRPPKGSKKWNPPQYEPITTLGKLGDYLGVPFFGSFRGSGVVQSAIKELQRFDTWNLPVI